MTHNQNPSKHIIIAGETPEPLFLYLSEAVSSPKFFYPEAVGGIRSLKSIIDMSMLNGRYSLQRSSLPPPVQLALHVDYKMFMKYLNGTPLPERIREKLAEALHDVYFEEKKKTATNDKELNPKPWIEITEELRELSRAHADSIASRMRQISCFLFEEQEGYIPVTGFTTAQIELLGQIKHDRWNTERL
ncbi:hypothetical protein K505DRAFT_358035 [Melanomma pulvis-pyrius CBS 109.77]|uniref:Uncharacterized protein n=1 Tax=Melanomma pulvis-pyrius CBS 109.77 TaxID=1314802 RepID=A0A6A6XMN8_9PLEO|nr:hypothetical protein K505DRAFT_358035 [Melanomma pulvis-pyrius CBS 109.77]